MVDAGLVRADSGKHGGAGGDTEGRGRVGVGKDQAAFTQFLEIGCDHFSGVSLGFSDDPGVEVIGDEEKDVHPFLGDDGVSAQGEETDETSLQELMGFFHEIDWRLGWGGWSYAIPEPEAGGSTWSDFIPD